MNPFERGKDHGRWILDEYGANFYREMKMHYRRQGAGKDWMNGYISAVPAS